MLQNKIRPVVVKILKAPPSVGGSGFQGYVGCYGPISSEDQTIVQEPLDTSSDSIHELEGETEQSCNGLTLRE